MADWAHLRNAKAKNQVEVSACERAEPPLAEAMA